MSMRASFRMGPAMEMPSPASPRRRLRRSFARDNGVDIREPEIQEFSCTPFLSLCCRSYPVSYQITTMTDSPLFCSRYMVARRSEDDFRKLSKHLLLQFTYSGRLKADLGGMQAPRLKSLQDDDLLLQCGYHKKFLLWVLEQPPLLSNHSLHAFLGCKNDRCPSMYTEAIEHFPPYRHTQ